MTSDDPGEGLVAAIIQISAHAERIAGLDAREAEHYEEIAALVARLAEQVSAVAGRSDDAAARLPRQAEILQALDELEAQVAQLTRHLAQLPDVGGADDDARSGYRPVPVPAWWKLAGKEREAAIARLRAWVEQIYRPGYGLLAAMLPPCWEQHPICLYTLDWLSELWSVLYVSPDRDGRSLAAQGEWQTRLLIAAAEQMATGAAGCQHSARGAGRVPASSPVQPGQRPSDLRR